MADLRTITQQIRFLLMAVTWCCVLLLNNQEITTYYPTPQDPAEANSHLHKTTSRKEQTAVKQKVIFEATTSYFILPLVLFTHWLRPTFYVPPQNVPDPLLKTNWIKHFFSVLFASVIIPNAP